MSYLKYKGYLGTIEPDLETCELFGKLAFMGSSQETENIAR